MNKLWPTIWKNNIFVYIIFMLLQITKLILWYVYTFIYLLFAYKTTELWDRGPGFYVLIQHKLVELFDARSKGMSLLSFPFILQGYLFTSVAVFLHHLFIRFWSKSPRILRQPQSVFEGAHDH